MRNPMIALLAATAALGLAGCSGEEKEASSVIGTPLKTFHVVESEFKLAPSTFTLDKAGTYAFEAVNRGQTPHSLEIEGEGIKAELEHELGPGESGTLTVDLEAGTYKIYCPVDGHEDQGMKGSIGVERTPSADATDEDDDSTGRGYGYGN